jgi:plastocyanin
MMRCVRRFRRTTAVVSAVALLHACGGGGAAPLSEPNPPEAGTPPTGGPPTTPPAAPPTTPQPPAAPSSVTITTPERTFSPTPVTIAANGTVTWQAVGDRHEIKFVGTAPAGGSPGELEEGRSVSRTFTAAGTYDYECLRHRDKGMRGTIVVQGSSTGSPPPTAPPPSGSTATITTPNATFSPSDVTIPAGGSVTWQFSGARHNVTFQGTAPSGGNVPDQDAGTSASRTFAVAGTYNYLCTRHAGMTGRVIVQ